MPQPQPDLPKRIAWASITLGARNYGNMLIEWALGRILDIPQPAIAFDSFTPMPDELIARIQAECDLLLSPGCTTLQAGQNPAYDSFGRITLPKPCFGGCVWPAARRSRLSMALHSFAPALRRRHHRPAGAVDLSVARRMSQPIGSRDPFTHDALTAAGIESRLIGCPTLQASAPVIAWRTPTGRELVFSLARSSLPAQWRLLRRLRRKWRITLVIHEPYERRVARLMPAERIIEYESGEQYVRTYAQADVVVTGRLHGALPAIAHGTPVLFFGDAGDTRYSLLTHLGIPIRPLSAGLASLVGPADSMGLTSAVFDRAAELRAAFAAYARGFGIATRL